MSTTSIEKQKLFLDYIRTFVIVGGVIFAVIELENALQDQNRQSYEATAAILSQFGEPELIDAAQVFFDARDMPKNNANYLEVLRRLTPLRQQYIIWSACSAEGICLDGASRELMCTRVLVYEASFEDMANDFAQVYDSQKRRSQYFGEFEKCQEEFAQVLSQNGLSR